MASDIVTKFVNALPMTFTKKQIHNAQIEVIKHTETKEASLELLKMLGINYVPKEFNHVTSEEGID